MKTILFLLSFIIAGCDPYPPIENEDKAVQIVWYNIYGAQTEPPQIEWIGGEKLKCAGGKGFFVAIRFGGPESSQCVGGAYWEDWRVAQVAHYPDNDGFRFSLSSFAHELWHAHLYRTKGDGDGKHEDPGFGRDWGHPYGAVDIANEELTNEDL